MNFKVIQLLFSTFMIAKLSFVSSQFCFSSHEGGTVSVACSSGLINFASYGTSPTGTCGAYNISSCHAPSSYSVVANACINQPSCSIDANSIVPIHLGSPTDDAVVDDNEGFTVCCCDGTLDGNRDDTVLGLSSSLTTDESTSTPSDPSSSPITDTPTATLSTSSTKMITNDDFIQAAEVGDLQRLKELIAEWKVTGDFDINATNKKGATALILASYAGHINIVQFLIDEGAKVNAHTDNGISALWIASYEGYLDIVKFLVTQGADLNVKENNGATALMASSQTGHLSVLHFLVSQGADVNAHANNGITALWIASSQGHIDIVKFLVTQGADVNAKDDENGETALMVACIEGYLDIVKYLVEIDVDLENIHDDVELIAYNSGHIEIVEYLKKKREEVLQLKSNVLSDDFPTEKIVDSNQTIDNSTAESCFSRDKSNNTDMMTCRDATDGEDLSSIVGTIQVLSVQSYTRLLERNGWTA